MGLLVCKIELDKNAGGKVTIENPDASITQTITMDGTTLKMEVKGPNATSSWTQVEDKITIDVKAFEVKADTITMTSQKESKWDSKMTMALSSTQEMSLKTDNKLTMKATMDGTLTAMKIALKADTDLKMDALNTTTKSTIAFKAQGLTTEVAGQVQSKMSAPIIQVSASGMLTAEGSGIATLKGGIVNVSGSLVKLG